MAEVKAIARRFCSPVAARRLRALRRVPHARVLATPACCHATQMIQVGDKIPAVTLIEKQSEEVKTRDLFAGKLGVLLGMPGAPCCDLRCTPRLTFTIAACFLAPLARRRVHAGLHQGTSLESARCCAELPWRGRPYACDALLQKTHLPGYINHTDELRAAGVQEIAVCCVNDPWVMSAWAKDMGTEAKGIRMLADPRCDFSQALGCTQDDTAKLGNVRSRRYSMVRRANATAHASL